MSTVLFSVGDASGDGPAADLARALAARRPDLRMLGMGGSAMRRAGVDVRVDQRELAIGGLFELGRGLGGVARAWRRMAALLDEAKPDLVVLVDSGGFNLPIAKRVRQRTDARVLYYTAPQVWAWRTGRIGKLARRVDHLAVIFPFEPDVYAGTGLAVDFVGHPLVDQLAALRDELDRKQARERLGLGGDGRVVVLLPGSRNNEVARHLALQLETAKQLLADDPALRFVLALSASVDRTRVEAVVRRAGVPVEWVCGQTHEALLAADLAIAKPGTVTVEATLLDTPMVVVGRANPLTAAILRRAVRAPFYAMPNLIAGREIVPEWLQQEATPDRVAASARALLDGPERRAQLEALREVADRLGHGGAAQATAAIAEKLLASR